ncbi:techylectin-5A, partial [Caerostris extrusa]
MSIDGEGWTVIQRRGKFPKKQNFNLKWEDYKNGFGDLMQEFWLGNENIYALTNQGECEVRFDMQDNEGNTRFAVYSNFKIDDESSGYVLHIGNYTGNA